MAPLLLALLVVSWSLVAGFQDGEVSVACGSMTPRHGHDPQTGVRHDITVDKTWYHPGDQIKVSLSGSRFTGFLIEARDAGALESGAVGAFSLLDEDACRLLTCGGVQDSAVSQTSNTRKERVEVYWTAPSAGPQHVQFLASVVEKYSVYWVKIPGPVISQSGAPPLLNSPQTATLPAPPPSPPPVSLLTKAFSSSGCGSDKFCVRSPQRCDPQRDPQCFFLSFTRDGASVLVEMSGPGAGYLAFGLSHDQWMGDDDVYMCVMDGQSVAIHPAYTRGRSHPQVAAPGAVQEVRWRLEDGILFCSFRRFLHIPDAPQRFPLDRNYYIFLTDGAASEGSIHRHERQPLITRRMYNISGSAEDVGGSRAPLLIKFHGAMMFVAWMTAVSIGVLVARFFKPVWPKSYLFGEKIWFQVHRLLMVVTVLLTVSAFVLPFLYRGHWSARAGYHPILGCAVLALAVLQQLLAVLRPPPHSPRRLLFNWMHWGNGTAARILAVAAIFLGMDLQALDLPDPWDTYTMVGFVLWHVCADLLLEGHSFCLRKEGERRMEDRVEILHPTITKDDGHTFRRVVLTVYICGNFAFLITFLAAINQI